MGLAAYGSRQLPAEVSARVLEAAGRGLPVVPARDSATVVLLRDGVGGLETYLLRRAASMAFAAGMHAFPGGAVDPRDADLPAWCWAGPPAEAWAPALSAPPPLARALVCAAVRETFEETGVLLAGVSGGDLVADVSDDSWEADRLALLDRSESLAGMLARRHLVLRADCLRLWAHWITPEVEPRRYDTRFFLAALPAGQRTRDVGGEADAVTWLRPQQALDAAAEGSVGMLPPTACTLAEIGAYSTSAAVLAAAAAKEVRPVLPRIVRRGDQAVVLLPGEVGYSEAKSHAPASGE